MNKLVHIYYKVLNATYIEILPATVTKPFRYLIQVPELCRLWLVV